VPVGQKGFILRSRAPALIVCPFNHPVRCFSFRVSLCIRVVWEVASLGVTGF
jgi:hypothetical protein